MILTSQNIFMNSGPYVHCKADILAIEESSMKLEKTVAED